MFFCAHDFAPNVRRGRVLEITRVCGLRRPGRSTARSASSRHAGETDVRLNPRPRTSFRAKSRPLRVHVPSGPCSKPRPGSCPNRPMPQTSGWPMLQTSDWPMLEAPRAPKATDWPMLQTLDGPCSKLVARSRETAYAQIPLRLLPERTVSGSQALLSFSGSDVRLMSWI